MPAATVPRAKTSTDRNETGCVGLGPWHGGGVSSVHIKTIRSDCITYGRIEIHNNLEKWGNTKTARHLGLGLGGVPTTGAGKAGQEELHLIGTVTQHIGLVTLKYSRESIFRFSG